MSKSEHRTPGQALPPEQRYQRTTEELERLVWAILLRPELPANLIHILDMGALVEILPNVYVQIRELVHKKRVERSIRLWFTVHSEDGVSQEIPLLHFQTKSFPSPDSTEEQLGMNLRGSWWEIVQQRLEAVLKLMESQPRPAQLPAPAADQLDGGARDGDALGWWQRIQSALKPMESQPRPAQLPASAADQPDWGIRRGATSGRMPVAPAEQLLAQSGADMAAALARQLYAKGAPSESASILPRQQGTNPSLLAVSRQTGKISSPSQEARQLQHLQEQMQALFVECLQVREEIYMLRDTLERSLIDLYYSVHPTVRLAARHLSEEEIRTTIAKWVEQGCPAPDETALLPVLRAFADINDDDERERRMAETLRAARDVAVKLDQTYLVIDERNRVLQKICALAGGHKPRRVRDEQGVPRTLCARCDAPLSNKAPERQEGWLQ